MTIWRTAVTTVFRSDDWFHAIAITAQVVIKKSDICYEHGPLLYSTLSQYIARNRTTHLKILETATARGFSALCMAKALHDAGQPGTIVTFDVIPNNVKTRWNCIADNDGPRTRAELLADYAPLIEEHIVFHQGDTRRELKRIDIPRLHFAYLDGMHTYDYLMHEFGYLRDKQRRGDVIFFDDYTPRLFPGVVKAVDEICERHGYSNRLITLGGQRGYAIAQKS